MSDTLTSNANEYTQCEQHQQACCYRLLPARESILGEGMKIRRLLPHRKQRMIGAWCFFDHAGPVDVSQGRGVRVGPHPHTGLQTFSWMMNGEILHRDSLGYKQILEQGQVNLMTAGRGISHSEESPEQRSATLQLAQFWIALPENKRNIAPAFEHYPDLPVIDYSNSKLTVLVGEMLGHTSPVKVHTPLLGLDISSEASTQLSLPLKPEFEYGIAVLTGKAQIADIELNPGSLLYLGSERTTLDINIQEASQIILLGGEPFKEDIMLYWNFLGKSTEEIREFIHLWHESDHFGTVQGYDGEPIPSPEL